jgi:hypothetical protein
MKDSMIVRITLLTWIAIFTVFLPITPEACVICFPYPKTTLADRLIKSESVVMAREKIGKPYFFTPVQVFKKPINNNVIKAFIDSSSRRKLKQNHEDVVVLVRQAQDGDWRYIAYADIKFQTFIRSILEQADDWVGINGSNTRVAFFAERITDSNRLIREQAYLELGRAPYYLIKKMATSVPRDQIRGFLSNWRLIEWHSLYILMLGQSQHPDDREYIRMKFETAARYGFKTNLSAWVTAFVEAYPNTGIHEIEALYFSDKDRAPDELKEVCKGLSVLGSEGGIPYKLEIIHRRRRIVRSYATLLKNHPVMAGEVAKDLTIWKIQALVDPLSNIIKDDSMRDRSSIFAVNYYLSIANRFPKQ